MHPELQSLISDFVATVDRRFAQLQREIGVAAPESRIAWATNGLKKGTLSDGAVYTKHGVGCLIEAAAGGVDFDFGERGEIDGFDAWRLVQFAENSSGRHSLTDKKKIEALLASAMAVGEIERRGSLYHLKKNTDPVGTDNDGAARRRV